jgi:hypothetical protein
LRQGQLVQAAAFNIWGRHASSAAWEAQLNTFKALLREPQYQVLLTHKRVALGSAALPVQRQFLQEVLLYDGSTTTSSNSMSSSSSSREGWADTNSYKAYGSSSSSGVGGSSSGRSSGGWGKSEVSNVAGGERLGDGVSRFLWRMAMHGDGCWMVKAIEAL